MSDKPKIILIRERLRESLAKDAGGAVTIVALWSLGYFAESAALQWAGVIIAFMWISVKALQRVKPAQDRNMMTPDQARKWLDVNFPQ